MFIDRCLTVGCHYETSRIKNFPRLLPRFSPALSLIVFLFVIGSSATAAGQTDSLAFYLVQYTDKNGQPQFDLAKPSQFLSRKALKRRRRQCIPIDSLDLPVCASYIEQILPFVEDERYHLRWLNASLVVLLPEDARMIREFDFVNSVVLVGDDKFGSSLLSSLSRRRSRKKGVETELELTDNYHGYSGAQIESLGGKFLHEQGWNGNNKRIAVLDGGFQNLNNSPFFDTLMQRNGIIHRADLIGNDTTVNHGSGHGSQVLSVLAANIPGLMVGTAPGAEYLLYRTESQKHQALIEELNWAYAVEQADSLGADIISSSLGYTQNTESTKTHFSTQAARIAWNKGILIISSVGNSGNTANHDVMRPASSKRVLSVGSIDENDSVSDFSSFGNGRPDFVAQGDPAVVASVYETRVNEAHGTSFSAPLIAGLAACLWQAHPRATNQQIFEAIRLSCTNADHPQPKSGYGEPNFKLAVRHLERILAQSRL